MIRKLLLLFLPFEWFFPDPILFAHPGDSLFQINHPFPVTISYDFHELNKNKMEDTYLPGEISYYLADSTFVKKTIRIRPRGNSRRDQCQFPPLRIHFNDSAYQVPLFDTWNKMKLVSKCMNAQSYDKFIIKEYLVYKAFENLTDYSFKTYLVDLLFVDTGDSKKTYKSTGFIIEDIDDLVKRLDAVEIDATSLHPKDMDPSAFDRVSLFQYMIGNTDWYIPNLHNIKLVKIKDVHKPLPIPVPYDFDYAGLINTNYAVPHETVPIESVRERYYMGLCREKQQYLPTVQHFLDKKDEIYQVFGGCNLLSNFEKKDILNYLDDFYQIISNEKLVERYIYKNCKK